jgi:hydroxymethylpyrimidine pyrophosphatase-like HAD family hydrolase
MNLFGTNYSRISKKNADLRSNTQIRTSRFGNSSLLNDVPNYTYWLATDCDGTYIVKKGDGKDERESLQKEQQRLNAYINTLNKNKRLGIIMTTGRGKSNYMHAHRLGQVPEQPDFYILGEGRYIIHGKGPNKDKPLKTWEDKLAGFDEAKAKEVFSQAAVRFNINFQEFLDAFPSYKPLEYLRPCDGQVSRYVHITDEQLKNSNSTVKKFVDSTKKHLEDLVAKAGMNASVVVLPAEEKDYYIFRVKPKLATKEDSLKFLMHELGISKDKIIVAGDNYNDAGLFHSANRGLIAGTKLSLKQFRDDIEKLFKSSSKVEGSMHLYRMDKNTQDKSILNGLKLHLKQLDATI